MQKRKLIEVSLPLEAINRESAREKSIRHGHPSTLHLWWARRPLAAARAVLFAQLVDDPSARPDEFPTEEAQRAERERLHDLIERLVVWENTRDEKLLAEAHAEILKSTNGKPPPILDPFAGGGTIPLEAQRLGLEAHASDLNPVAVLINKALIEIPPEFRNQPPVFPGLADTQSNWRGAEGLAADVRAYGQWMRDEAEKRIGHLYPDAVLADGTTAPVIAWLWARTVTCPNPACGIEMPLVRSWWLGRKPGKETYIQPVVTVDHAQPGGRRVRFAIGHGHTPMAEGTVNRSGAVCVSCQGAVPLSYVRNEGRAGRLGTVLMALVVEGPGQRHYLPPTELQIDRSRAGTRPSGLDAELPAQALGFRVQGYGFRYWRDLFTHRQLITLDALAALVQVTRQQALQNGAASHYADAIATYLGMAISRMTDYQSSLAVWSSHPKNEVIVHVFGRQALPMTWDFAEGNPFGESSGSLSIMLRAMSEVICSLGSGRQGRVNQADAATRSSSGFVLSTDPPYYDNIAYADLSDYFYVWLRHALREVHPGLFATLLTPKAHELVADPFRHSSPGEARIFFEGGFRNVFASMRSSATTEYPATVYYAFKQQEGSSDSGQASTGWEAILEGMLAAGWEITSTWPMRTELGGRLRSTGSNALASSIVLSIRPRPEGAQTTDRREFVAALESELPIALRQLEQGQVAPVDLPQAAIGPGMAVFSRYDGVLEPDGSKMTVRSALARINEILDQVLNEQEGDFDATTRFALAWYRQHGYAVGTFGDADNLARARNTSVDLLGRDGILTSRAGNVQLIRSSELPWDYDVTTDRHTSVWEALHHLIKVLERDGIAPAGEFLQAALARPDGAVDADLVKELAHLLFRVAEGNGATKDALSFNALVTSWPDILDVARAEKSLTVASQATFDFDEEGA